MNSSCAIEATTRCLEPNISVIGGAALVDSINPCAIAVLLILLAALMSQKDKKRALKMGLVFISAIFLAYLLLGIGLIGIINLAGLAGIFHKTIGVLAILIGILNIKDFIWYGGGGFVIEIPRRWRPTLKLLLSKATTTLGVFATGFLVTLFELPCTGGPYVFVLGLLSQNLDWSQVIPILIFYNLVFVTPLFILTGLIYFGFATIEKTEKWKERNLRLLHLIAGIIMIALGIWVFIN
jgi:cytochrome c biogenesis protein CcdA